MAPQRLAAMLASLLLIPVALAAPGDLDATDPAGDPSVTVGIAPMPAGSCNAPTADVVALRLRADPRDLAVTLTLRDLRADLTCGDTNFGPALHSSSFVEFYGDWQGEVASFGVSVSNVNATTSHVCWRVRLTSSASADECRPVLRSALYSGSAWTWRIPLSGTAVGSDGTDVPYDLRGETYRISANAHSTHGTAPLPVARAHDRLENVPYAL